MDRLSISKGSKLMEFSLKARGVNSYELKLEEWVVMLSIL